MRMDFHAVVSRNVHVCLATVSTKEDSDESASNVTIFHINV